MRGVLVVGIACVLAFAAVSVSGSGAAGPTTRTVYVTVVDSAGKGVPGLTAADFTLKEGGKDREIASVEPAKQKLRLALMLEETIGAQGSVRAGLAEFVKRMCPIAEIALIVVTQTNRTAVDFTSDLSTLTNGINNLTLSKMQQLLMLPEGVLDVAKKFEKAKPARPAIVLIAFDRDQAISDDPQGILNEIAKCGALFSAVTVAGTTASGTSVGKLGDVAGMSQMFDDGSKESGGRRIQVLALTSVPSALQQIADDLSNQYLITYTLPDGVKPADRLAVTLKKPGLTLRAPTRIPK